MDETTSNYVTQKFVACRSIDEFMGEEIPARHYIPPRTEICTSCFALLFKYETPYICCKNHKVELADWSPPHHFLQNLFTGNDPRSSEFLKNIRAYNSIFSFVSLGVKMDSRLQSSNQRQGRYSFSIQGSLYHRIGPLLPDENCNPEFAQIYFVDTNFDKQVDRRFSILNHLDRSIIAGIQEALNSSHPYVQLLRTAREQWDGIENLSIKLIDDRSQQDKRYCQPTCSEIAVIITDFSRSEGESYRDIILRTKQNRIRKINELHPAYDSLAYPLFGGNIGFQLFLKRKDDIGTITIREFYAYRLHQRPSKLNILLYGQRLFQQYIVDQYAKAEGAILQYMRHHQVSLKIILCTSLFYNMALILFLYIYRKNCELMHTKVLLILMEDIMFLLQKQMIQILLLLVKMWVAVSFCHHLSPVGHVK